MYYNFNNYGSGIGGYYQYPQQQKPALYTQPLSDEALKRMLSGENNSWSLNITEKERDDAICTHKNRLKNNEMSITDHHADGSCQCYICKERIHIKDYTEEEIIALVEEVVNVLQLTKLFYLDMPNNVATGFFTLIPMLRKIPGLYKMAIDNFGKYENDSRLNPYSQNNAFNVLGMLMNPGIGMNMQGYPQQGFSNPYAGPQQPIPTMDVMSGQNPLGFNPQGFQPQPGYNPQGFPQQNGFNPQGFQPQPGYNPQGFPQQNGFNPQGFQQQNGFNPPQGGQANMNNPFVQQQMGEQQNQGSTNPFINTQPTPQPSSTYSPDKAPSTSSKVKNDKVFGV